MLLRLLVGPGNLDATRPPVALGLDAAVLPAQDVRSRETADPVEEALSGRGITPRATNASSARMFEAAPTRSSCRTALASEANTSPLGTTA